MPSDPALTNPNLVRVLVAEDNELVLAALQEQLLPEGFQITAAKNPKEAQAALGRNDFSIVLADQEMPGMPGLDFLAKVKESHPTTTRLLMTSSLTLKDLFDAIKSDIIHRYICKPWMRDELLVILRNSVACNMPLPAGEPASATDGASEPTAPPAESEVDGEAATEPDAGPIVTMHDGDVAAEALVKSLSVYHPNLGNTAARARVLCQSVCGVVGLGGDEAQGLIWAGALHDISLVGVDRPLVRRWLRSAEKFTGDEMALIRKHPHDSEAILRGYPIFKTASEIVRCHHENWDGTGYPDRLQGEAIPWLSRLLAIVIFFCSRHHAAAQVMADIQNQAEKMFDRKAVEAVIEAAGKTELPRGEREIQLGELQPGMVVACDIYSASGMLILTKGRELTTAWINKIMNINNATPLNPYVLVFC